MKVLQNPIRYVCSTTETAESVVEEMEKSGDIDSSLPKCSQHSNSQSIEFTSKATANKNTLLSLFDDPFR